MNDNDRRLSDRSMDDLRAVRDKALSERKNVAYVIVILISVCILATIIIVWKLNSFEYDTICSTSECLKSSFFLLDLMFTDPLDPCDNFYNFTCGNFKGHLLVHNFQHWIDKNLHDFTTSAVQDEDSRSVKLQKKYYEACMNITRIENDKNKTLKKLFEQLGGWPILKGNKWKEDAFDWGKIVKKSKDIGFYYDWFINIKNSEESIYENRLHITVPDNVNKIGSMEKEYVTLMTNVAVLLGAPGNFSNISESMNRVMAFELGLAEIIQDSQVNATEERYTIEEIKYKYPNTPWSSLFKYAILPWNEKIIFNLDSYIPKLEEYLNTTDKRVQADYIFWKLTESFSQFLTYPIRKQFENYADISMDYRFLKNRAHYCYEITSTVFAYVSEAEFVRKNTIEKESIRDMVNRISVVLRKHIDKTKWMSEDVKKVAHNKISNMIVVIGGPEEMYHEEEFDKFLGIDQIDISGLNNTVEIICKVDKSRDLFNLDYRKPKLTTRDAMLYQGVTNLGFIKYIPDENVMFLPAAALNGVFYTHNRQNYLNYGALGTIIGHELAHSFGLFGYLGLEKVLNKNETLEEFFKAAQCLLEDCNNIGIDNTMNMDCRRTFHENFADYAGINLSYEAYMALEESHGKESSLPGLNYNSRQLFWIIYSSVMCNNIIVNSTEEFTHMLPFQRILGAYRNSEYFAKDFNCPVDSNMNPQTKCKVL